MNFNVCRSISSTAKQWLLGMAFFVASSSAVYAGTGPVQVVQVSGKSILAADTGRTLYVFDQDKTSDSTCYAACALAWPAATTNVADLKAPFGRSTRRDGSQQITYQGRPLYRYFADLSKGDTRGDGFGGTWHVVVVAPSH